MSLNTANIKSSSEIIVRETQVEASKVAKQGVYMEAKQGERARS
ncbi:hypothetical protein [Candidatus Ruthia endofausta]|nr:hypothetical protein [Candidatus Ruthia endofausta]